MSSWRLARIVWASEGLVLFAALILFWTAAERLADTAIGSPVRNWFQAFFGRESSVAA